MDFLSTLQMDVKLLLVGGALALLAALLSGSKRNEHRYIAVFALLMVGAGYRYHQETTTQEAASVGTTDMAVNQKAAPRSPAR